MGDPTRVATRSIRLPARRESLGDIRAFVESEARRAALAGTRSYRLALAVDEVATNVIVHGYEANGLSGDVTVRARATEDALTITLEDDAVPFDPRTLRPPSDLDAPIEQRGIGGLGVFLALRAVDRFEYARTVGRNRNLFTMVREEAGDGSARPE